MSLALELETYLLARPRWVPIAEICANFQIEERQLRAEGRRRPIHARFAISSARPGAHGLKHFSHATLEERLAYKHSKRRSLIAYARAIKEYNLALKHCLSGHFDATGHGVMNL